MITNTQQSINKVEVASDTASSFCYSLALQLKEDADYYSPEDDTHYWNEKYQATYNEVYDFVHDYLSNYKHENI